MILTYQKTSIKLTHFHSLDPFPFLTGGGGGGGGGGEGGD